VSGERRTVYGILAVRDEVDIVRINVLHHLHTACDRIIVVDNGSSDGTTEVLKRLAAKLPVEWTVDKGAFTQSEIVSALADEARAKGAEWVLPLDADEFWNGTRDVRELAGVGCRARSCWSAAITPTCWPMPDGWPSTSLPSEHGTDRSTTAGTPG